MCPVGPESNLLHASAKHAERLYLPHPVLLPHEMVALRSHSHRGWSATTLDASYPKSDALSSPDALQSALAELCDSAEAAVHGQGGAPLLVLSQKRAGPSRLPIPSLLAVGAVHQYSARRLFNGDFRSPGAHGRPSPNQYVAGT